MQLECHLWRFVLKIYMHNAEVVASLMEMFLLISNPFGEYYRNIRRADPHRFLLKGSGTVFPDRDALPTGAFEFGGDGMCGMQVAGQDVDAFDLTLS